MSGLIRKIQIRDIYFNITLEGEQEEALKEKYQPFLTGVFTQYDNLASYQPSELEADLLVNTFFNNVDPFVRILHKDSFLADLSLFRKGKLSSVRTFNALLFSVYGLAAASFDPKNMAVTFGANRESILDRYQESQEVALHQLDFVNSNRIPVFQIFLYYLVCSVLFFSKKYRRPRTQFND